MSQPLGLPYDDVRASAQDNLFAESEEMELNFGPQHPATHGVLRLKLKIDGEKIVGASTGVPMTDASDAFKAPFATAGIDPAEVFYFGESVLLPEYRGHGIGVRFFDEREAYARRLGRFRWTAFCAVERSIDHPRRPRDYVPLNDFWTRRGYRHHPELNTTFSWRDLDEENDSAKPMSFWIKELT